MTGRNLCLPVEIAKNHLDSLTDLRAHLQRKTEGSLDPQDASTNFLSNNPLMMSYCKDYREETGSNTSQQ